MVVLNYQDSRFVLCTLIGLLFGLPAAITIASGLIEPGIIFGLFSLCGFGFAGAALFGCIKRDVEAEQNNPKPIFIPVGAMDLDETGAVRAFQLPRTDDDSAAVDPAIAVVVDEEQV